MPTVSGYKYKLWHNCINRCRLLKSVNPHWHFEPAEFKDERGFYKYWQVRTWNPAEWKREHAIRLAESALNGVQP